MIIEPQMHTHPSTLLHYQLLATLLMSPWVEENLSTRMLISWRCFGVNPEEEKEECYLSQGFFSYLYIRLFLLVISVSYMHCHQLFT